MSQYYQDSVKLRPYLNAATLNRVNNFARRLPKSLAVLSCSDNANIDNKMKSTMDKKLRHLSLVWLTQGLIKEHEYNLILNFLIGQRTVSQPDRVQRQLLIAKMILIGGISLVIAAVIYFIAANWKGMAYGYKLSLLGGATLLAYTVGFLLLQRETVISHLSCIVGCWFFGGQIALIGQIYNSHADAWQLFAVWMIPATGLAATFKSIYFPIKSLLLFNLSLWLFLFPSALFGLGFPDLQLGFVLAAIGNALIFTAVSLKPMSWLRPTRYLAYVALLVFTFSLTMLNLGDDDSTSNIWTILYFLAIPVAIYISVEIKPNQWLCYFSLLVYAILILVKSVEFLVTSDWFRNLDELVLVIFFLLGVTWLSLVVFTFWQINQRIKINLSQKVSDAA